MYLLKNTGECGELPSRLLKKSKENFQISLGAQSMSPVDIKLLNKFILWSMTFQWY